MQLRAYPHFFIRNNEYSPPYSAPESLRVLGIRKATHLWAIGMRVFHAVCNQEVLDLKFMPTTEAQPPTSVFGTTCKSNRSNAMIN